MTTIKLPVRIETFNSGERGEPDRHWIKDVDGRVIVPPLGYKVAQAIVDALNSRDQLEAERDKWASWFTYTAEILGVEPTQKAVEDAINALKAEGGRE